MRLCGIDADEEEWKGIFLAIAAKPNEELDQQIQDDECETRYQVMKAREPLQMIKPDNTQLVQIIRAYCNSDPSVTVTNQGFIYIISGLLNYFDESFEVYRLLMHIMLDLSWHTHFMIDIDAMANPRVAELHERIEELAPELYSILKNEGQCEAGFQDIFFNMYNYTIFSLCFGCHIPIDISARILDWVLFMHNKEHGLIILLVCMLKICESKIMGMSEKRDRFRYISQAEFVIECFQNEAYLDTLVRDYLAPHVLNVFEDPDCLFNINGETQQLEFDDSLQKQSTPEAAKE